MIAFFIKKQFNLKGILFKKFHISNRLIDELFLNILDSEIFFFHYLSIASVNSNSQEIKQVDSNSFVAFKLHLYFREVKVEAHILY